MHSTYNVVHHLPPHPTFALSQELKAKEEDAAGGKKDEKSPGRLRAMINTVIGNLQLRISNLHVRYEDGTSYPGHNFAVGLMLTDIIADTVDEAGRKAFVTANVLKLLRKVRSCQCYLLLCRIVVAMT